MGAGIQKICEACQKHGIPEPEYSVLGGDITAKFTAPQSSKMKLWKKEYLILLEKILKSNKQS